MQRLVGGSVVRLQALRGQVLRVKHFFYEFGPAAAFHAGKAANVLWNLLDLWWVEQPYSSISTRKYINH